MNLKKIIDFLYYEYKTLEEEKIVSKKSLYFDAEGKRVESIEGRIGTFFEMEIIEKEKHEKTFKRFIFFLEWDEYKNIINERKKEVSWFIHIHKFHPIEDETYEPNSDNFVYFHNNSYGFIGQKRFILDQPPHFWRE